MYMPVRFDQKINMCVRGNRVAHHHHACKRMVVAEKSGRCEEGRLEWEGWAIWISALAGSFVFGGAGVLVGCPWK